MIKVENIETWGFEHAIRGMRNPLNSWNKSDSYYGENGNYVLGENDLELCRKLIKAGTEHRKFLRQIFVSVDITAPLYWWKEFDTYKVGTVSNSCSTMHKITSKEFSIEDFSFEHLNDEEVKVTQRDQDYTNSSIDALYDIVDMLNTYREMFLKTKNKKYWWQIIQLLPSSYNQRRTITMNYENLFNIINQRSNHKLDEWVQLCSILRALPYVESLLQ